MISAYWRSTLLMVYSQVEDSIHPDSSKEEEERETMSPTAGKQPDVWVHPRTPGPSGPTDVPGAAWAQQWKLDPARLLSTGSPSTAM